MTTPPSAPLDLPRTPAPRPLRRGFPGRLLLLVAAAVTLGTVAAGVATAATPQVIIHTTNFAGYIAGVPGTVSSFSGSMSIPAVTCPATGTLAFQPTVDIHTSGNFLTFQDSISCNNGTATSGGFFASIYPGTGGNDIAATNIAAKAGDVVKMKLTISTAGIATMTVTDAAAKSGGTAKAPVTGTLTTVQAGTDISGSASPTVVPSFTPPAAFGSLKAGSASLKSLNPAEYEIYNGSTLQVSTSTMTTGGSFRNTFAHS